MSIRPRQPDLRRPAFSLVEAVMASLIVGVVAVSALQTVGSAVTARRQHVLIRKGDHLARALMEEIMQTRYAEPCDTPAWGREAGESADSRINWDDVDDYDGLVETAVTDKLGNPVPGAAGWQRRVSVKRVSTTDLNIVAALLDTGLKQITVVARSPEGHETTLVALRAPGGAHDAALGPGQSAVTWAGLSVKLGEDGGRVAAGTGLLNRPAP